MGWVFVAGASGVDHFEGALMPLVPRIIFACLLAVAFAIHARSVSAATVALSPPATVKVTPTGYMTSGAANSPSVSGGAFPGGMSTRVAGKAVTVPAQWRMASNAARFATTAIRLNPKVMVGTAVASWLFEQGMEYANDQWTKESMPDGAVVVNDYPSNWPMNPYNYPVGHTYSAWDSAGNQVETRKIFASIQPAPWQFLESGGGKYVHRRFVQCPGGRPSHVSSDGACVGLVKNPATDADWDAVAASPLPDAAATELIQRGAALPINPEVNPAPIEVPLSDPYTDPVTGQRYQDIGKLTPSPSNPMQADLQVSKRPLGADDKPLTDPTTGELKPPENVDDPCLEHPDRVGCMNWGEHENPDLESNEKKVTISAQSGWGADTAACPADLTAPLKNGGVVVAFSYAPACTAADTFRPIIIALAWISAVLIAMGIYRRAE